MGRRAAAGLRSGTTGTDHARWHGRDATTVIAEVADSLVTVWCATTPLCAFNASFDLSLLHAELRRHQQRGLTLAGPVVDPHCIDHHVDRYRKGKRTLAALCTHYQVRLDDAHSSAGTGWPRLAWPGGWPATTPTRSAPYLSASYPAARSVGTAPQ